MNYQPPSPWRTETEKELEIALAAGSMETACFLPPGPVSASGPASEACPPVAATDVENESGV